jgi:hypothetical protein
MLAAFASVDTYADSNTTATKNLRRGIKQNPHSPSLCEQRQKSFFLPLLENASFFRPDRAEMEMPAASNTVHQPLIQL